MSAIYDNWDRLVAAVLKKQQLWILFHQHSRSPSILSQASDSSSTSFDLGFESLKWQQPRSSLVLVSDFSPPFDFKNASRASSVLLGRGTFGSAYKVTREDGARIVVKLFKSAAVPAELNFNRNMEIVGYLRHENVVALRAYYSSENQRFVVYDYYAKGSMYSLLHGQSGDVEWETRLDIAIGAARGIAAIHSGMLVHGNIKASNVFLNHESYGCVSDLGLSRMINITLDAPQVKNSQNMSQASDVYAFGILLLELLTRRSSVDIPGGPAAVDLVKLVNSANSKEKAANVFDTDLLKIPTPSINKQMVKVLQIGIECVAKSAEKRPKMSEVVKMLEGIKRLVFVDEANPTFDLEDLLRAPTEVLGKGTFGTCYLVRLETGKKVVVKRLKDVIVSLKDFQQQMEVFGRMGHRNVAKLRAYYFSRDKKLLVYDYYDQGNVYTLLHGGHLGWGARLEIALGAARGVAHIHRKGDETIVHGNVKSSNIFLNGQTHAIVSDVGLAKLCVCRGREEVSQASDVYNIGVVLLELVCGRPSRYSNDGTTTTLVKWVQLAVIENLGVAQIFDANCLTYETEEAMKQVFQIAMDCVNTPPEHRPKMHQVVEVLEEISVLLNV